MRGGIRALLATAALATAGCTSDVAELDVRAVADPLTKAIKPGNPMVVEARGLLALGNVGLAIEAYRKVLRAEPESIEALAGLAECYDRMGRPDLSRAKYENALALAPKNSVLLRTFAASLERQGRVAEGRALRIEANTAEAEEVAVLVQMATPVQGQQKALAAVAVSPPPAPPAAIGKTTWVIDVPAARPLASVTVTLPQAALPRFESSSEEIGAASHALDPAPARKGDSARQKTMFVTQTSKSPRLERLSLGEVALVTSSQPRWRPEVVRSTALSTTVRFVPLTSATRFAGIRLLNAARHHGLAARTRLALNRNGWNRVTIGNAQRTRDRSLVLYSPATAGAAKRLAAEFGFGIAKDSRPGPLTVLLGRDSIGRMQSSS